MRSLFNQAACSLLIVILATSFAVAQTVETYIKQLKDKDPEVRAKAAYELGGG